MQPTDTQPLLAMTRGEVVELIHRGAIVVVSTAGETLYAYGNPSLRTYLRSAAKPFQMLPLVERGARERFGLTTEELAVCAASHSGEPVHVETVRSLLRKADVPETALQCGPHLPIETESAYALIRRNALPTAIHSNCSGKHAGMLVAAQCDGEPLETYLAYDHPLQRQILRTVGELSGVSTAEIVVSRDGCGAPIFAIPLDRIARLFAHLSNPECQPTPRADALKTVRNAMMRAPYLGSGKGRLGYRLMETFPGKVVLKSGAAGVYGIGWPGLGIGIGIKVESGEGTTLSAAALRMLKRFAGEHLRAEALDALWEEFCPPLKNTRREVIGECRWLGD